MKRNTKKNLNLVSKVKFAVFHINPDGSRGLWCGNVSGLRLIDELMFRPECRKVVVLDRESKSILEGIYGSDGLLDASMKDPHFFEKVRKFHIRDILDTVK